MGAVIRSMTGFGAGEAPVPGGRLRIEVRTVNHRFFSANIRLARGLDEHETLLRETLRARLRRGHANITARVEPDAEESVPSITVDLPRARALARALEALKDDLGLEGGVDLALLTRLGDIVTLGREEGPEVPADAVTTAALAAADGVVAMRETEGAALAADLLGSTAAISAALAAVEARAPQRLREEAERLRARVRELTDGVEVEEDRLAKEIAILAERWDVAEETVRLRAHIEHFGATLREPPDEPVGKRLGFLVQEMHREVNTIGAKANDTDISHRVIEMKNDVERLREQVENVE